MDVLLNEIIMSFRRWSSLLDCHCCLVWQQYTYNSLDNIEYNSCSIASSSSSSLSSRNCSLKWQFQLERFGDFLARESSDEDVVSSAACAVETTIDSCAGVCRCSTSRTSPKSSSSSVSLLQVLVQSKILDGVPVFKPKIAPTVGIRGHLDIQKCPK